MHSMRVVTRVILWQNIGVCFQYRVNPYTISNTGNIKIKMEAILNEKKWYESFYADMKKENKLGRIDEKYLTSLMAQHNKHFDDKFKIYLSKDINKNILRIIYWLKNGERYGISKKMVLYVFIKTIPHIQLKR